jgi:hypothetical protein
MRKNTGMSNTLDTGRWLKMLPVYYIYKLLSWLYSTMILIKALYEEEALWSQWIQS